MRTKEVEREAALERRCPICPRLLPTRHCRWLHLSAATGINSVCSLFQLLPLLQVQKKIPNKDTPIIVGCSNGTTYSIDALELLDEAGYTNLVGLKG